MTTTLAVYDIFQGTQVRKVDRGDGKTWRVFADCCEALGFRNTAHVLKRIPKQHIHSVYLLAPDGRNRKYWIVDEIGLLDVIAYSRLPREQVDAFRELIGQRATAMQLTNDEIVKIAVREAVKELSAITGMSFFNLDTRISQIEYDMQPKKKPLRLTAGERKRAEVLALMDGIINKENLTGFDVGKRWNGYYRQLEEIYGVDLIAAAKRTNRKTLDIVEKEGYMDELIGMIKGK